MPSASASTVSGRPLLRRLACATLAAAGVFLAACASSGGALPEPGASGLVVVRLWEAKGGPPAMLQSRHVKQLGSTFEQLLERPPAQRQRRREPDRRP